MSTRRRFVALPSFAADTALTALAGLFAITTVLGRGRGPVTLSLWPMLLAVMCALALLSRSRWPLGTLIAVGTFGSVYLLVTGSPIFPILPAVFIALYSAIAYSIHPRLVVWVCALGMSLSLLLINQLPDAPNRPVIDVFGLTPRPLPMRPFRPPPSDIQFMSQPPLPEVANRPGIDVSGFAPRPIPRRVRDNRISERLSSALYETGWMLTALLLGEAMRNRRSAAQEAELRAVQAERARQEMERAQQEMAQRRIAEERLQIARELHDVLAHTVALINVQAGVAAHVIDRQPDQAREALLNIKAASHATLQELRSLVGVLREGERPAPMVPAPGLGALDGLLTAVREAGLTVDLERSGLSDELPATVDLAAYRILQEALTNVIKHAQRAPVRVVVHREAGRLTLDVVNIRHNGRVQTGNEGAGHGLVGMQERTTALGGVLEAGPLPDGGFRVHAILPIAGGAI